MGQSPSSKNYTENPEDTVLIQGNQDLNEGRVVPRIYTTEITKKSVPGDIILTVRAPVGDIAINRYDACIGRGVCALSNMEDNNFIYYYLEYLSNKHIWNRYSQGSTFESINSKDIKNLKIKVPSLEEQNKISNLLVSLDNKITSMEKKLFYSELLKIYFLQNLIKNDNEKPKLRFPEFTDDWKTVKIGKIFDERVEKKYNDLELLSVTISNGVIKRSEIEDKDTSSSNKSNYKHVQKGDLVYNSMRMWQGASGISNYEGIVSPAYTVLIPKESINSKFYGYYFKKQEMLNEFQKYSQGLTSDTWNLKYPLISQIKVKKPPIEEQNKITELLNKLDQKIKNTKKYIKRNKEFKRSLISKMFC